MQKRSVLSARRMSANQTLFALAACGIVAGVVDSASGALFTWSGAGANTNINTAANWSGGANPGFTLADQAQFTGLNNVVTINVPVAFGSNATGPVPAVAFNSNFTVNGASNLTLYGTNTGGTPVLRTNSTPTSVTINAPIAVFSTTPSVAPLGNLFCITVNNTGPANTGLNITNGISLASGSSAASYDIRYVTAGAKGRIAGTISGLGSLVNGATAWSGDLIIAGNQSSTTSSNILISSGGGFGNPTTTARIVLGEAAAETQTWNNFTLNNVMNVAIGGTITANVLSGTASAKITGTNNVGAVLKLNSGTIGSNIALGGAGTGENVFGITKQNAGTLSIDGAKTYTGPTIVNGGTLNIANTGSLVSSITLNAGAALSGEGATSGSLTFGAGQSTLNFDVSTPTAAFSAASVAITGSPIVVVNPSTSVSSGTFTVLKSTAGFGSIPLSTFALATRGGSLVFSGTDLNYVAAASAPAALVWKGNDAINPTFWDTVNTVNWTNGGSPDRFYAGDNLTFNDTASSFNVAIQGGSQSAGDIAFNNATNAYAVSGAIGGTGTLTKTGAASVTLGGAVTRTGAITVSDGLLSLGSATNSITGSGGIVINNGGELRFVGTTTGAVLAALGQQNVTLGGGTITFGGTATTTNDVQTVDINANGSGIKVDTAANITWRVGGAINGTGNWTKSGAGVLALGQNNDSGPGSAFSGKLTVTAGTLDIRHPDSLGTTAGSTDVQNATLLLQNFGQTAGTRAYAEPLNFSGTSFLTNLNQQAPAFTNRFTGSISVSGTLNVSTAIVSGATSPTLEFNGSTITTTSGSTIVLGKQSSYPVATVSANQTINISDAIVGPGSLTVDASVTPGSMFVLSGTNTYSGPTVVGGGTLSLATTGSISNSASIDVKSGATLDVAAVSGFTVPVGQTLKGNGVIKGGTTIAGTLAPGASAGLLTFNGSLTLANSTTEMQLEGSGAIRGADVGGNGYDAIDVIGTTGTMTYDGVLDVDFIAGAPTAPASYDLFNFIGTPSSDFDAIKIRFAGVLQGSLSGSGTWNQSFGGTLFTFTGATGILSLSLQAVPEPITAAGVLLLAGRILGRRSRDSI